MEKRGTHPIPARRPRVEWRKPCRKRHSRRSAGRMQKPVAAVGARPTFAYINFSIITPSFATVNRANAPSDHGFSIILHPPKDTVIINRNRTHPGGPSAAGMQPRPGNTAPNPTPHRAQKGILKGRSPLSGARGSASPSPRPPPRPQTPCVPLRPKSQNRPEQAIRARPQTHAPLPKANSAPSPPSNRSLLRPSPLLQHPHPLLPLRIHPVHLPERNPLLHLLHPVKYHMLPLLLPHSHPPIIKATGASKDAPVAQSINSSRESEYRCTASCRYPPESACR